MLVSLRLVNFRCFDDHIIPFRPHTVIIGRNNAGKSTVVEALRLVAIIVERHKTASYKALPVWLDLLRGTRGIIPALDRQAFDFSRVFHRHGDPPARIVASFSNDAQVEVYIGPDNELFGVIRQATGRTISGRGEARDISMPSIGALPQVAPVRYPEPILDPDYVRRSLNSVLAPYHFRNQIAILAEHYPEFKRISEYTWPELQILDLQKAGDVPNQFYELHVRNEDFVADISWMGHGLQMWLQTMWFLARAENFQTVILDEPDVYMHADLQRRLARFLRRRSQQFVVATHSVEFLSEVEPEDVLVLDRSRRAAVFATDWPEIQQVITHVGGVHNIQLARLIHSRKCLMVEGEDLDILRRLHDRLFPDSRDPLQSIPVFTIGGWGGWEYVIGSSIWITQAFANTKIYCALDRDYHTDGQVSERRAQAMSKGIDLVVWNKKEIENFLLVPAAICRALSRRSAGKPIPQSREIESAIDDACQELKASTLEDIAGELQLGDRKLMYKSATASATKIIYERWQSRGGRSAVVSGKKVLSSVNRWLQQKFALTITTGAIAGELQPAEIDDQLFRFLTALEHRQAVDG